jgi:hypothetical protein
VRRREGEEARRRGGEKARLWGGSKVRWRVNGVRRQGCEEARRRGGEKARLWGGSKVSEVEKRSTRSASLAMVLEVQKQAQAINLMCSNTNSSCVTIPCSHE